MSVPLTINGVTFSYPQEFDKHWGPTLTNWSTAVTNGMLQKAGGTFTLTADVDFGASFGLKSLYYKSREANIAATGILRLANASTGVRWRNAANNADLDLTVNASNLLTFNGSVLGTNSLTNTHIYVGNASNQPADVAVSGDITITNTGAVTIANSAITNVKVSASAAIALTKLASTTGYYWYVANTSGVLTPIAVTASKAVATDSNGLPTASTTTATELGYVAGVTSAIQTQINGLSAAILPPGTMLDFGGSSAPTGFLACDGSAVSRSTYSALFSAISTTWGVGDGSTTFNLPGLARRTTIGSGGSGSGTIGNSVGNTGGEETHTLTTPEIPSHTHTATVTDPGHTHGIGTGDNTNVNGRARSSQTADNNIYTFSTNSATTGITVGNSNTGGGGSHNNIQPSAVVLKIIKY